MRRTLHVGLLAAMAWSAPCFGQVTGFPEVEGWTLASEVQVYDAENLWEYINGAADMYLAYDFKKVATLSYDTEPKGSITVDVYEHADHRNGRENPATARSPHLKPRSRAPARAHQSVDGEDSSDGEEGIDAEKIDPGHGPPDQCCKHPLESQTRVFSPFGRLAGIVTRSVSE